MVVAAEVRQMKQPKVGGFVKQLSGFVIAISLSALLSATAQAQQTDEQPSGASETTASSQVETAQEIVIDEAVAAIERSRIEAIEQAIMPTVAVLGDGGEGGGSGVVISPDGYALTNFHVTSPFGNKMRGGMSDGKLYPAVLVGVDPTGDLAMIKLLPRNDFPVAKMGDSRKLRVGDWCFAIGNPFLLATNLQPSVSYGLISGIERYQYPAGTILEYADCIQTDAAINPGNSGGPLFNRQGELIGINGRASFEKRGRVNVGVGYAISINQVKNFIGTLKSGRYVDHATLGATVSTDDSGRVRVSNILNSSDAYRRGLRYGDEILEIAGRAIRTTNELKNVLGTLPNDWRVKIRFRKEDEEIETLVRLAAVHTNEELVQLAKGGLGMGPPPPPKKAEKEKSEEQDQAEPADAEALKVKEATDSLWKSWFEQRDGFANYHFNRLEKDRVLGVYRKQLGDLPAGATWKLVGSLGGDEGNAEIELSDDSFALVRGGLRQGVDPKQGLSKAISKQGIEGLPMVLGLWRQLLLSTGNGQGKILDNALYLGTMPLLGNWPLRDVLEVTISDTRMRMIYDPETGLLSACELYGDEDDDPVELYLDQYQMIDGRQVPGRIVLQYGMDEKATFKVNKLEMTPPVTTKPESEEGS
jgi:S1-C subfamily serine protease